MKYDCDVIKDLLPLYQDDTASAKSKSIVDEHLVECSSCQNYFHKMMHGAEQPNIMLETCPPEKLYRGQVKTRKYGI